MENIVNDIKPRGISSAYIVLPFDKGKEKLEKAGYHIISLEENASLRIQEGKDAYISRNGNWVKEGNLYVPKKGKFLTKNSPVIKYPVKATNAHRNGIDFYLTEEQVEDALKNSIKLKDRDFSIPTNRFGENEITGFCFGKIAEDYGLFLKDAGIKKMSVVMVDDIGEKPFIRQTWFNGVDYDSRLDGVNWYLSNDDWVRGVCEDALASEPKKFKSQIVSYSIEQIKNALKKGNLSGLENTIINLLQ